jgi:hypothetical protein
MVPWHTSSHSLTFQLSNSSTSFSFAIYPTCQYPCLLVQFSHCTQLTFGHSPTCHFLVNSSSFQLCYLRYLSVSLPVSSSMAFSFHLFIPLLVHCQAVPLLFSFSFSPSCQFPCLLVQPWPPAYFQSFPYLSVVKQFYFLSALPSTLSVSSPACCFSHRPLAYI